MVRKYATSFVDHQYENVCTRQTQHIFQIQHLENQPSKHHIAHLCSYMQDGGGIVENAVRSDLLLTWVIGRQSFAPNLPREYKSPDNGTAAE